MKYDASHIPMLLDDLEAAVSEMKSALGGDAAAWARAAAGRWSAAQHAEHIALNLEETAAGFERCAEDLRHGRLGSRPRRWPLQALAVRVFMREPFPRGGKAPRFVQPGPAPARDSVFERLDRGVARYRALCASLTPELRERAWIVSPYRRPWHYRLFEMIRVQTTHARHHTRLAAEAAKG